MFKEMLMCVVFVLAFNCYLLEAKDDVKVKKETPVKKTEKEAAVKEEIVADINGTAITKKTLDELWNIPLYRRQMPTKEQLLDCIVEQELFSQEARRQKFDKRETFRIKMEQAERELLSQEFLLYGILDKIRNSSEAENYYNEHKNEFKDQKVKVRHILVRTEQEAKDILKALKEKKANFETLAKEKSMDKQSAPQGGDLGIIDKGLMVAPFDEAAFALKEGEISDIVRTPYGFHIIKCDKKFPEAYKEFSTVKNQIDNKLYSDELEKTSVELRKNAKISINKELLK